MQGLVRNMQVKKANLEAGLHASSGISIPWQSLSAPLTDQLDSICWQELFTLHLIVVEHACA